MEKRNQEIVLRLCREIGRFEARAELKDDTLYTTHGVFEILLGIYESVENGECSGNE